MKISSIKSKAEIGRIDFLNTLIICCLEETHFTFKDTSILKIKGWKKYVIQTKMKRELEQLYEYDLRQKYH